MVFINALKGSEQKKGEGSARLLRREAAASTAPLLWLQSSRCHVACSSAAPSSHLFASSFFSSGNIWKLSEGR